MVIVEWWGLGRGSTVEVTWEMNIDANGAVDYRPCVARAPC